MEMTWKRYVGIGVNWTSMCHHCHCHIIVIASPPPPLSPPPPPSPQLPPRSPPQYGNTCSWKRRKLHQMTLIRILGPRSYNPLKKEVKIRSLEPNENLNTVTRWSINITAFSQAFSKQLECIFSYNQSFPMYLHTI
jgi:hypothetical protein